MNTLIQKAIDICGGTQTSLAITINAKQQYVSDWLHGNRKVTPTYAARIERATKGEVPAYYLCPDPDLFKPPEQKQSA